MDAVAEYMASSGLTESIVSAYKGFVARDGFKKIERNEFEDMLMYFADNIELYGDSIPIITDGNSNFVCLYVGGKEAGSVWLLNHDEFDKSIIYENLDALFSDIKHYEEAWDIKDLLDLRKDR